MILVVNDEYDNSSILTIGLGDTGFEIDAYNDPELALYASTFHWISPE